MNNHRSSYNTIPTVLSIPEKLSAFLHKLLRLRFPIERHFSGRDILMTAGAAILLILAVFLKSVERFKTYICLASMLLAAVPLVLQGLYSIRSRRVPLSEATSFMAAILATMLGKYACGALILVLAGLLSQVEAYTLLHREAAQDYLAEARLCLRHAVENSDMENSPERRLLASVSLGFYALYVLIAIFFAILTLMHLSDYKIWLQRSLVFLLLASPSAVLFSASLTHFGAMYSAAKADILFHAGDTSEIFSRCKLFAFSKTGTVTDGRYVISDIAPVGVTEQELLRIAAVAESKSNHPIAITLKEAAGLREGVVPEGVMESKDIPGKGVSTYFSGHQIYIGNAGLLEEHGIWYQIPSKSGSAIHVAVDSTYRGYIMISDTLRENAFEALEELRALGASTLVMLTGDVRSTARTLASALNFDMVKPELKPEEKGSAVRYCVLYTENRQKSPVSVMGSMISRCSALRTFLSAWKRRMKISPAISVFSQEVSKGYHWLSESVEAAKGS